MNEQLKDQVDMPDYNPAANAGRGNWGLRDVSEGNVFAHPTDIVRCIDHGAMNSVSATRTLWRCLTCGRAAYRHQGQANAAHPNISSKLPDGTVVPVVAYDNGRSVLGLEPMSDRAFIEHASHLIVAMDFGFGDLEGPDLIRRHVLFEEDADGGLTIQWHVETTGELVTESTPGAIAVVLTEV